jgi:ATP-binding cassette, subfamily B, heavy metal transporter
MASKATDTLYNFDTVALFNTKKLEVSMLDVSLQRYEHLAVKNEWMYAMQNVVQTLLYTCGLTAILVIGAFGVTSGAATTTVGDLVMMSVLLQQLWVPVQYFGWQYREAIQAGVDVGNLFRVFETESSIADLGLNTLQVEAGEIVFDDVSFAYPKDANASDEIADAPAQSLVLKHVSFRVPPGQTVALVGPSGAGKSSIMRLLTRVYDVTSGSIRIDGEDIADVSLYSLRQSMSVVPQHVTVWNDTVTYNLLYGRPDASKEEVVAAAKAAELHETIMEMPQGYNTVLGEKGVRLSGGEAQRLAAARALLKDASIILCDEWTASLDSRTEAELTKSLNAVGGRTKLIVAHRLFSIFDADLILVLRDGAIVEQGTHNSLLTIPNGVYADMWRRQSELGQGDDTKEEREALMS